MKLGLRSIVSFIVLLGIALSANGDDYSPEIVDNAKRNAHFFCGINNKNDLCVMSAMIEQHLSLQENLKRADPETQGAARILLERNCNFVVSVFRDTMWRGLSSIPPEVSSAYPKCLHVISDLQDFLAGKKVNTFFLNAMKALRNLPKTAPLVSSGNSTDNARPS